MDYTLVWCGIPEKINNFLRQHQLVFVDIRLLLEQHQLFFKYCLECYVMVV